MKRFIWFLILVAVTYAAWKYYPEIERLARERTGADIARKEPSAEPAPKLTAPAEGAPKPDAAISPLDAGFDPEIVRRYPMPVFKPIEALVGDWKAIPRTAFPRQVTIKQPLDLKLSGGIGNARLEAGTKVVALAAENGSLSLAPALDSPLQGELAIDQTDFKTVLAGVYERFKARKRDDVLALRRNAQESRTTVTSTRPAGNPSTKSPAGSSNSSLPELLDGKSADPSPQVLASIGPRPPQNADGTVPAMITSINERQAAAARKQRESEPKLADIKSWTRLRVQDFEGEPYWASSVRYTARTIFGEFPAEALALIRQGKVVKWVYAGTGEPVF
jgi:hypothetical protein